MDPRRNSGSPEIEFEFFAISPPNWGSHTVYFRGQTKFEFLRYISILSLSTKLMKVTKLNFHSQINLNNYNNI